MKLKVYILPILLIVLVFNLGVSQTNKVITNITLAEVLRGNYNPSDYEASIQISHPDDVVPAIQNLVNPDSLKAYLQILDRFYTRNTGSDTLSETIGIGAARNWIKSKFDQFDAEHEDRLETGFFQFDQNICGMMRHKNVLAALPGTDGTGEIIIIEGHMDSRCETNCDVDCEARGMEDNGSGTALVIELARVMSQFTFDKTIVFMTTTGEEQGLHGAEAMAFYCKFDEPLIDVKAVLNNDVIGGIICGATSSEPSCPGENLIDSTQVRLFSRGNFDSPHKSLSRYIKLQYQQELLPYVQVPMLLTLMSAEDRTGRGGDHIPFGAKNIPAMRFTSAHEHGDAGIDEDYHDRQHTSEDVLGVDTDGDSEIDSFFVDFNYLARNGRINGVAAAMIAISPEPVSLEADWVNDEVSVSIIDDNDFMHYAVGVRTTMNDWDTLIYVKDTKELTFTPDTEENNVRLTVASVDDLEIESCFSEEIFVKQSVGTIDYGTKSRFPVELWQNAPNPFDEATTISVYAERAFPYNDALVRIQNSSGQLIKEMSIVLNEGVNELLYNHGYGVAGIHQYSLLIDGTIIDTKQMIFAN